MISRVLAKRLIIEVLLLVGLLAGLGMVTLTGRFLLQNQQGADSASALHEVATLPADAQHLASWTPDAWTRDRQLEPANRTLVEAAYIRAWAALGHLQTTGSDDALTDTFTARARDAVVAMPRDSSVATWDLGHQLTLQFYSLDGGTVAFSDGDASLARTVRRGDDQTVLLTHERYDVVMALVDGYWRIDQLRRGGDSGVVTVRTSPNDDGVLTALTGAPPRSPVTVPTYRAAEFRPPRWDDTLAVDAVGLPITADTAAAAGSTAAEATGVGPAVAVADGRWTAAEVAAVGTTLQRAATLGLTAVRVPLNVLALGGADPSDAALANVSTLFAQAEAAGVGIVPVLFDGLADLSPGTWAGADRQLQQVVSTVRDSPALMAWDLMDGPESRIANGATATDVRAFLVVTSTRLHGLDPHTPVTITWHTTASTTDPALTGLVDFTSLQVDGMASDDLAAAATAMTGASGGRPIAWVTSGPATDGGWSPSPRTPTAQAVSIGDVMSAARHAGVTRVSTAAVEDSPVTGFRGVLTADGSPKPAAALLGPDAVLTGLPSPGLGDYLGSRFWQTTGVLLVVTLAIGGAGVWRVSRRRHGRMLS